ncbi:hypothetical protein [Microbacterium sp. Bi121]|uniref:hypothetical protein n=1 Tax=Microbacterium sp. Bi121 TaxID=2822348 RepID=UPI001DBACA9B|nr:hypothetical protein [Microbacterium sp. Bi121]CAH0129683.1 hypothetical protein SRABI121_00734 [Microbacterium sp. Bi121]
MSDPKDPEDEQVTDAPAENTRDDSDGFEPITPDGVRTGTPAVPDPKDSQNPPPRRL